SASSVMSAPTPWCLSGRTPGFCLDCSTAIQLAQVRHDTIVWVFFEPPNRSKWRGCNRGCKKTRCSVDLPSCRRGCIMTRSAQNVFEAEPSQQGRQGSHVLVSGGNGAHTGWSAPEDTLLPGRVEQFRASALADDR